MELMPGGDLHQYLHERGKLCECVLWRLVFNFHRMLSLIAAEQNTKYLAHQICSALAVS